MSVEDAARVGTQRERLDERGLRQPLLMEARRVDRFLQVHAVVDRVEDHLHDDGDDAAAAGRADDQHGLAVPRHDRRAHRRERPLAGRDRVGFALHQAVDVRHAGLRRRSRPFRCSSRCRSPAGITLRRTIRSACR